GSEVARSRSIAGSATLTAVPSMKAIAEPRMAAARIQARARGSQGCTGRIDRILAPSHGPAAAGLMRRGVLGCATTGRAMNASAALDAQRGSVERGARPGAPRPAQLSAGPLLTVARTARPS